MTEQDNAPQPAAPAPAPAAPSPVPAAPLVVPVPAFDLTNAEQHRLPIRSETRSKWRVDPRTGGISAPRVGSNLRASACQTPRQPWQP